MNCISTAPRKRKNKIISDDSSDEEPPIRRRRILPVLDDSEEEEQVNKDEENSILELIGEPTTKKNKININPKLAELWRNIIQTGLDKENKKKLLEKIPGIENCALEAPKLNEEIKVTLSNSAKTRDDKLCEKQSQIGIAIANLNAILKNLIEKNENTEKENIERVGDSIKILADLHFMESETRRAVILPGLNKTMKETLEGTGITDYLFGTDLHKIIKRSKDLEKTIKDLQQKPSTSSKTPLNYWSPSPSNNQPQGGQRKNYSYLSRIRNYQRNYYRYGGAAAPPARSATNQSQWQPRRPTRGRRLPQQVTGKKI